MRTSLLQKGFRFSFFFSFSPPELPVKIMGKADANTEKQFLVSDDIILVCELSRSNASVSWYKDQQLIDDSERYCSEEQGTFRSLVVLNAGLEDSGEYTCDAVDDKIVFYITVKGCHYITQHLAIKCLDWKRHYNKKEI